MEAALPSWRANTALARRAAALSPAALTHCVRAHFAAAGFAQLLPVQQRALAAFERNFDLLLVSPTGSGKTVAFLAPLMQLLHRLLDSRAAAPAGAPCNDDSGDVEIAQSAENRFEAGGEAAASRLSASAQETAREPTAAPVELLACGSSEESSERSAVAKLRVTALIVAPTQELAAQIYAVLEAVCSHCALCAAGRFFPLLFSGRRSYAADLKLVSSRLAHSRPPHHTVLTTTPGRLQRYLQPNLKYRPLASLLELRHLELLIVDETDKVYSLPETSEQMASILGRCARQRRTILSTATLSAAAKLTRFFGLRNPLLLNDAAPPADAAPLAAAMPQTLSHYFCVVPVVFRTLFFFAFAQAATARSIIAFVSTCAEVDFFFACLQALRIPRALHRVHRRLGFAKRNSSLSAFHAHGGAKLLVASNLVARGIDFEGVDLILQLAAPSDPDDYVHRVGRTARVGHAGSALLLLDPSELAFAEFLQLRALAPEPLESIAALCDTLHLDKDAFALRLTESSLTTAAETATAETAASEATALETATAETAAAAASARSIIDPMLVRPCAFFSAAALEACFAWLQRLFAEQPELQKNAATAFVSHFRAYGSHHLQYIFQVRRLSGQALAIAFGLPKVPRLKERRDAARYVLLADSKSAGAKSADAKSADAKSAEASSSDAAGAEASRVSRAESRRTVATRKAQRRKRKQRTLARGERCAPVAYADSDSASDGDDLTLFRKIGRKYS